MMPSYFFAHGAPSIVLENNGYTELLKSFNLATPKPKAIVLFSAHWEEHTQAIGAAETYDTTFPMHFSSSFKLTVPSGRRLYSSIGVPANMRSASEVMPSSESASRSCSGRGGSTTRSRIAQNHDKSEELDATRDA